MSINPEVQNELSELCTLSTRGRGAGHSLGAGHPVRAFSRGVNPDGAGKDGGIRA